jgi:dihydrofolate synthase/folylpolyglutamate synthase
VIAAPQEKEAREAIREKCHKVKARLFEMGRDIFFEKTGHSFNVLGLGTEYPNLSIKLLGEHQLINATAAVGAIDALRFYQIYIDSEAVRRGLAETLWPGRCEVVCRQPLVVLDGAQNIASAAALKRTIKENFKYQKLILVLGISSDKDIKGICQELEDLADTLILTQANNPRAVKSETLAAYFKDKEVKITRDVAEAKRMAIAKAKSKDLVLVTGSLFVVGEFRDEKSRFE